MSIHGYDVRKAAQVVAFFAQKEGGQINVLKLAKLIYLSDRESLERYDSPILYDELVSMPHGPVNSMTLNYINGYIEDAEWNALIADKAEHCIGLVNKKISVDELDELSEAEVELLESIWKKFGAMDRYALRDYTHQHCPEWEDPDGSSKPIPYERVLKFLGKDGTAIAQAIEEDRHLRSL